MKKVISLALIFCLCMSLFVGCAKKEPVDPLTATKRTDLVIGQVKDIVTLDPHKTTDEQTTKVFANIYDSLVEQGPNMEILPSIAENYEYVNDLEIVFYLRNDVKFHDGQDLTAQDVKFSLDRAMSESASKSVLSDISSVDIIDENTISVKLKQQSPYVLWSLGSTSASIIPKSLLENDPNALSENACGTGPMMLEEWDRNNYITLVGFDEYYKGKVLATSITFKVMPEITMSTITLKGGHLDVLEGLMVTDVDSIAENEKLKVETYKSQDYRFLSLNTQKEPFDNLKIRQAISHCIDKESIIEIVLEGKGEALNTVLNLDNQSANTQINHYPYDLEMAKKLMIEAGYPDGFNATMYVAGENETKASQIIQLNLSDIGINLKINLVEYVTVLDFANRGDYDMCIMTGGIVGNTQATLENMFHSQSAAVSGNRSRYGNAQVDEILNAAKREKDTQKRDDYYKQAQSLIIADAPVVPLYVQDKFIGMNTNMQGYVLYKNGNHDYTNAYVLEN